MLFIVFQELCLVLKLLRKQIKLGLCHFELAYLIKEAEALVRRPSRPRNYTAGKR